jgi:PAS domain S-box-containing protein
VTDAPAADPRIQACALNLAPGTNAHDRRCILWKDGERLLCRALPLDRHSERSSVLLVMHTTEHPSHASFDRLAHEYQIRDELGDAWSARPLQLVNENGQSILVLADPGGEPLARLLGAPMDVGSFLRIAIGLVMAIAKVHQRGLIHKDIKPAHVLVNCTDGHVRLIGFGIASRLPRERQMPEPPETIAGTLAYMAPEQTGRINRSIDSRTDLYSLGVTLYRMLTGILPFSAEEPMEWVHCHIAKQAVAPNDVLNGVPIALSQIIMKLLAKAAEERYQTAVGVERDLQHCLTEWKGRGRIVPFAPGQHDVPDRLLIPEKLYGREQEVHILLAAFDRVVKDGAAELVLVSGYSGIGKSSVVNELHKAIVLPRGLFLTGKFDQYKRDIPYSTLAQAFRSFIRQILSQSDTEIIRWRTELLEALGANGQLVVNLIPELEFIIGKQPPVAELAAAEAQGRFHTVFRTFLSVFASKQHPLALFLDDLQWLDAATLDLLEDLLTRSDLQHLMLIGAYRDNEVDGTHPLIRKLHALRSAGAKIQEIMLPPLDHGHIERLIADALYCEPEQAGALAHRVHEKTAGNPFFVIQFLRALTEDGSVRFDHDMARWHWDLDLIHAKGYTENVVDLMVARLHRLPIETQHALPLLACLGNVAASTTLTTVLGQSDEYIHEALWPAIRQDLVERLESSYRFIHDRVQEAAYSLIPERLRAETHLKIGRLLLAQTPPEKREEAIFELVGQLNRGATLITEQGDRENLAALNLIAGKRAKGATAYTSALTYLHAGASLLTSNNRKRQRELMFSLELNRAECEFLTGQLSVAEERLTALSVRVTTTAEHATVTCLRIDVCTALDLSDRSVTVCLDYLRHVGIAWSAHPTEEEVRREYELIWQLLGSRAIEDLIESPLMENPAFLATVAVLIKVLPAALFTDANLASLTICKAASLSLEYGNCDASCYAYVLLARIAGPRFGDYKAGFRFGRLGYDLVERHGLKRFEAGTYHCYSIFVLRWVKHVRACRDLLRRAFDAANRTGDLTYGAYTCCHVNSDNLFAGGHLPEVQREAEEGLSYVSKAGFGLMIYHITTQLALIRMLRGLTPAFGCLDDTQFNELRLEDHFLHNPTLAVSECWYWIRKLQARYIAGDYPTAMEAASKAQTLLWTSTSFFEEAEYQYYAALARAALCDSTLAADLHSQLAALTTHERQLQVWAENCPENFENRAALVSAEIARLEGRDGDAMRLYEHAIRSARVNSFVHNEAIAYERASAFYRARGMDAFAELYLRNARYGYQRWGAVGKVRQLEESYAALRADPSAAPPSAMIAASVEHLDLTTVIKVSQAVSGEIVLEKLIDTLMRTAIEHAGAQRGLLIAPHDGTQVVEAEGITSAISITVRVRQDAVSATELPTSVLHYVARTLESVILDDATVRNAFSADEYIRHNRVRSMLCLPLIKQSKLIGVLYLENNLAPRIFTPARSAVLKLIASQAAISLENTRLYRELGARESRIRRLVDANIIGIFIWSIASGIVEANDAFLRMIGYDRDDLLSGRIRWNELTPPEWLERDVPRWVSDLKWTGRVEPFEKDFYRKDGSRVPTLIGCAAFEDNDSQGVAFVLDQTGRKQAEAEARESERRYRDVQVQLAHANRLATMGQLTASITHEVTQPITAAHNNAGAALHFLNRTPPDLTEVREALDCIVGDTARVGDIVDRIRAHIKKAPVKQDRLDLNDAIREVIALVGGEVAQHGVEVLARLEEGLPPVQGDRVQLQQVVMNLVLNALEAMGRFGADPRDLSISSEVRDPRQLLVAIRDTGPGISPDSFERVFEPFYTTKDRGVGIGLSICRSIIDDHGGRLWAEANEPRGAVFKFTLPARLPL